jgi:hypothetical protein
LKPSEEIAPSKVTLVRLLQSEKAQNPMLVTLSGMFTLVRLSQLRKT